MNSLSGPGATAATFIFAMLTNALTASPDSRWKHLPSIPDPVGFAGMGAGVVDGRLVAFGGSHFAEKPLWLAGVKSFSDRIYTLAKDGRTWAEEAVRYPAKRGGFASTAARDRVYSAGGIDAEGCSREVYVIAGSGGKLTLTRLSDLPAGNGYGSAAVVRNRLYVVGGVATPTSTVASRETWSLDLETPPMSAAWRREPDLPGLGTFVAAASVADDALYLFGGIGYDADRKAEPSRQAFRLEYGATAWEPLPDLPEARVGASTPPTPVRDRSFFLIGGYAAIFPGKPREHPGFSVGTLVFDAKTRIWTAGPELPMPTSVDLDASGLPGPAPMIGAPCVLWNGLCVVVSGEVRPSVRTPAVVAWAVSEPFLPR